MLESFTGTSHLAGRGLCPSAPVLETLLGRKSIFKQGVTKASAKDVYITQWLRIDSTTPSGILLNNDNRLKKVKNQKPAAVLRELSPARIFARPTADDLWLGPAQESALSQLVLSTPVRALLGPPSSGRSTLLRQLGKPTPDRVVLAIAGPQRFNSAALKALLRSAGLTTDSLDSGEMRRVVDVFLRERFAQGQRVLVVIDDADEFGSAAFAEVTRLTEADAVTGCKPELILSLEHIDAGSSPAADYLRAHATPALSVLSWMSDREVAWYLEWRLGRFGLGGLITPRAARLIALCSRGSFAAVDHLCQIALLLLRKSDEERVDVALVRRAFYRLRRRRSGHAAPSERESPGQLLISRDGDVVAKVALRDRLLIGRSDLNDLRLDSDYLSRHHALILQSGEGYSVTDLNSENGVLLNGEAVSQAAINDGDVIRIGPYRIKVELSGRLAGARAEAVDQLLGDTAVMPGLDDAARSGLRVVR
jgi:type II secretory pathway predicted ATPase ExeA